MNASVRDGTPDAAAPAGRASVSGRGGARNARGRATVRAIEREAVRLASAEGADRVTVDRICAAAGVSPRTFFNHFAAKDDALLGSELPSLDEGRVRAYLADPAAPILAGALRLVVPPPELAEDPALVAARFAVLARTPALAHRQAERLLPLTDEVAGIVALKLRTLDPAMSDADVAVAAGMITRMAGALLLQPVIESGRRGEAVPPAPPDLGVLRDLWPRLI